MEKGERDKLAECQRRLGEIQQMMSALASELNNLSVGAKAGAPKHAIEKVRDGICLYCDEKINKGRTGFFVLF